MYSTPPISMPACCMMRSTSAMTARGAIQLDAAGGAADVRRAQVEGLAGDVDFDRIDESAVQHFDTHDMRVACGDELLHERGRIHAEGKTIRCVRGLRGRGRKLLWMIEALDARTAATDVRLDDDRPAETIRDRGCLGSAMNHARLRIGQAELFE